MQTNDKEQRPLPQRIESALNQQDGFNQELVRCGFNSSAEVAACRDLTELAEKIKANQIIDAIESPNLYELYRKAHRRQQLVAQVMRDVTVSQDPASRGLRHVQPPVLPQVIASELQSEPVRYAKPDSIQSSQSPAAYLKYIYDLTTEQITPMLEKWALDARRPDLRQLELSEDNLHQEITTLELVNEVLLEQFSKPILGYALDFLLARNASITVPNIDDRLNLLYKQSFTIVFWFKINPNVPDDGTEQIFNQNFWNGSILDPDAGLVILTFSSSIIGFSLGSINGLGQIGKPSNVIDNEWHHYAAVFNHSSKRMELYQDGVLLDEGTLSPLEKGNIDLTDKSDQENSDGSMYFARTTNYSEFKHIISEIHIWDYPLSQAEIQKDMSSFLKGNEASLMHYWPMNEGQGDTVEDKTERACHGSIEGENKPTWILFSRPRDSEFSFNDLKTQLHPLALPFNKELATVRTGLAQIEGMNVNALARRFQENDYALIKEPFTLTLHATDALNLVESEIEVLQQTINADSPLYTEIFGSTDYLNQVDRFIEATDITFEEFRQLYRDYAVKDEAGTAYHTGQRGGRFTGGDLILKEENGVLYMILRDGHAIYSDYVAPMNHLVRLYKHTGLAFHQLDQLLCSIPGAKGTRNVTEGGFKVLAHYLYWRQQYNLGVDKYVALLTEINCWQRIGQQKEPTLMRQMFGRYAPQITTIVLEGTTKLSEVEEVAIENGITLGDILRRGLKLTRREWEKVVSLVMEDDNTPLNQQTLARLYRLATLFPLFNWDILSAIQLVGKIDPHLLTTLGTESDEIISKVLPALDKLAWLSQWMASAELSVTDLLLILTPPEEAVLQTTQQVSNWLHEFNQAIDSHLLNSESHFAIYHNWVERIEEDDTPIYITIEDWLGKLQSKHILDNSGLVQSVTKSQITTAVTEVLTSAGVDNAANEALKNQLIDFLAETQFNQEQVLFEQVIKIAEDDNPEIVGSVLRWVGTSVYEALSTLLSGTESEKLQLLYDLGRHLQLTSKLSFTSATVEMLCEHPQWLVSGMTIPVSLKQVYYLERFKQLQNTEASEPMWLAYFMTRWGEEDIDSERVNKLLALLLDFNQEDIKALRENADGEEMKTVQQVEALSRQIQLCRDLSISATELITLSTEGLNSGTNHAAAATAVLGGMARSGDENLATLAENALNEKIRDALVAAVFSHVIAEDEQLKDQIKDSEDLYSYLLLDVNVSSAVPTSRIVEAHATVQLYINRMLENIEFGDFTDKDALKEQWETAQQYRVWEANEKLQLHAGNYIEPELRYNKTDIFKTFEQNISQGYLDETMIETALYSYMQELQRLTELQPTGFCQVRELSPLGDYIDYYFTAKASWSQMTYYHRHLRLDVEDLKEKNPQAAQWGEWKRIDLPATNQTVFGLNPAYAWNRLFLLWFELEERRSEDGQTTTYHLLPRYTRQGVDGSFGEPFTPSMSGEVVGKLGYNEPVEPTIYQANFQKGKINLFFTVEDGEEKDKFLFEISQTEAEVSETERPIPTTPELSDYEGTQSIYATDEAEGVLLPSQNNLTLSYSGLAMYYFMRIDTVTVRYSLLNQSQQLKIEIPNGKVVISASTGAKLASSRITSARYEVYINGTKKGEGDAVASLENPDDTTTHYHLIEPPPPFVIDLGNDLWGTEFNVKFYVAFDYSGGSFNSNADRTVSGKPVIKYTMTETVTDYMYLESSGTRKQQGYLVATDVAEEEGSRHILHLVSPGLGNVPEILPLPAGVRPLFSLENQSYPEIGVDNFIEKAEANDQLSPIQEPKPQGIFDFDGSMGLYGWEVFYHIPSLLASKYADNGDYEQAKRWLSCIYDPSNSGYPWGVRPLILDQTNNGVFSITDPDREALRNPIHYQHATIRHSLEDLLSQGDDVYRQETQETLQQAKMCYVVAKNFFREEFAQQLDILTASDWNDPILGNVSEEDFRPPTNEELLALYQTIEERLHNLRHWLTIDGEPLNVPLLAAPINPQQLQLAALSGLPATQAQSFSQMALPYSFEAMLAKAQSYTKELMSYAQQMQAALEKRDDRLLEEIIQENEYQLFDFSISLQNHAVEIAKKAKESLQGAKRILEVERDGQKHLAGEFMNELEATAYAESTALTVYHSARTAYSGFQAVSGVIANIFGLAAGGMKFEAPAESMKEIADYGSSFVGEKIELFKDAGAFMRRQDEARLQYDVLAAEIDAIDLGKDIAFTLEAKIEDINLEQESEVNLKIFQELTTLQQLKWQREKAKHLVEYNQRRFTNSQFYDWYIGHISNLYRSSYDATVKFARMAESAFQIETGDLTATFIGSHWDRRHKGILAGQALWLDLQRMDLAYWSRIEPETEIVKEISLLELQPSAVASLQSRGEVVFYLKEALFEVDDPTLYNRKIQGIRVSIPALEKEGLAGCGRLTQIDSRLYYSRHKDVSHSIFNPYACQSIVLGGWQTDSSRLKLPQGRLKPFQGTGVDSTWHLSFPAVVAAKREKRNASPQQQQLKLIDDVVIEVTYSARM